MTFLYVTDQEGRTFKLDAKSKPLEWPYTKEKESDASFKTMTYTTTLSFKANKRFIERINWALAGCDTRKEYRKFKKTRKRLEKAIRIISRTKRFDNPRKLKSLNWFNKILKTLKYEIQISNEIKPRHYDNQQFPI